MTIIQRSPNLGLTVRMQRLPVAAAVSSGNQGGGGDGGALVAGWFAPVFDRLGSWSWESELDGLWSIFGGGVFSSWAGDPGGADYPEATSTFRCVELEAPANLLNLRVTTYLGVVQGVSMSDVSWRAVWDVPSPSDPSVSAGAGNSFTTWGNVIAVQQVNTGSGGVEGEEVTETLTATAYSGDAAIETIVLHCFHPAY